MPLGEGKIGIWQHAHYSSGCWKRAARKRASPPGIQTNKVCSTPKTRIGTGAGSSVYGMG